MKHLQALLQGKCTSHILPFLWMKGEDNETIKKELDKIEECGIREVCLESRPHPDFCGPKWWENLDFICEEAEKRGLRLWILDDKKFPTGYANGGFEKHPEKSKLYLGERHMDIMGPCRGGAVLVENFIPSDGRLLGILAVPKPDGQTLAVRGSGILDLTDTMENGFVYFDLPEGAYRLFILFTTRTGGGRDHYMNLIDSSSVKVLLDEVYEKHYARYSKYFGNVIAGFFSDEPELGNVKGYPFDNMLGQKDIRLPWSDELERKLTETWKEEFLTNLPALWYDSEEKTAKVRTEYMDAMTHLVHTCFSGQIGSWCQVHGVEYIGHIIEDDNAHARMGCSIGHYFREMEGQHMAGIDVVHHQIVPGFTQPVHQWIAGDRDGEFFHFGLAKLGSSAAHIQKNKKDRALCEIFGNYGWAEGNSFMKWLTNHMLVRGINEFTPHAFSMKYPDPDCPPHFYAGGNNPGFECFTWLMQYMNRSTHFLSSGTHLADAAILYHGESEWCGEAMYFQKPGRALMEKQLDYDVIPADILAEAIVENGVLKILDKTYASLILPYVQCLDERVVQFIEANQKNKLKVYIIDKLPEKTTKGTELPEAFSKWVEIVTLDNLAQKAVAESEKHRMRKLAVTDSGQGTISENLQDLRMIVNQTEEGLCAMLFNESVFRRADFALLVQDEKLDGLTLYDSWFNRAKSFDLKSYPAQAEGYAYQIPGSLEPGESCFLCLESIEHIKEEGQKIEPDILCLEKKTTLYIPWKVTTKEGKTLQLKADKELPNMNGRGYFPAYTGSYLYTGSFTWKKNEGEHYSLKFPEAADCLRVKLNGEDVGYLAGFPAKVEVTDALLDGENHLEIKVDTTLVWKLKDGASTHLQVSATGITEAPVIETYMRY